MTNIRRALLLGRLGITYSRPSREMPTSKMDQLQMCKDEAARRLLLGKSEQFAPGEYVESHEEQP